MGEFTFDTSGAVEVQPMSETEGSIRIRWSDLSPFAQGYIEAAFASASVPNTPNLTHRGVYMITPNGDRRAVAFSDLAPETLAAMLGDCEAVREGSLAAYKRRTPHAGGLFWETRKRGGLSAFPPITLYLGDDGRIYQREASDAR